MIHFTEKEINWLVSLVGKVEVTDSSKFKLENLTRKLESLNSLDLPFEISEEDIKNTHETVEKLDAIFLNYSRSTDITDVRFFDNLKREISGLLVYLSTYKDLFNTQVSYMEDMLKKEIRIDLAIQIKESQQVSFTQADKLVEKDTRYVNLRDKLYRYKSISTSLNTKYNLYSKLWQMLLQSVSTAIKERHMVSND